MLLIWYGAQAAGAVAADVTYGGSSMRAGMGAKFTPLESAPFSPIGKGFKPLEQGVRPVGRPFHV
jgi:hypothetical protein